VRECARDSGFRGVVLFFGLACVLSWPILFVVDAWLTPAYIDHGNDSAAATAQVFGHMLGMLGPAAAAIAMWRRNPGLPRPSWRWSRPRFYAIAGFAALALFLAPASMGLMFGDSLSVRTDIDTYRWVVLASGFTLLWIAGMGEEVGWTAYLLPRLAPRLGRSGALLLTGAIRGIWHWPVLIGPVIYDVMSGESSVLRLRLLSVGFAFQLAVSNAVMFGGVFGRIWFKTESMPLLGWTHQWFDQTRAIMLIMIIGFGDSVWATFATFLLVPAGYVALVSVAREEGITLSKWGWPRRSREDAERSG